MDFFDLKIFSYLNIVWGYLRHLFDIIFVALIFYWIYTFFSKTRATQLLKGVVIIVIIAGLSVFFMFDTLNFLITKGTESLILTVVILFQPELRRLITQFGKRNWISYEPHTDSFPLDEIVNALISMADNKIGALIVIERSTGLKGFIESGIVVDAEISEEFIRTIFYPLTPMHDGAIIIQGGRIASAACYLPLSDSKQLKKHHGARHRAALGIAEETDALVLIVSEESGAISIMVNGKIFPKIKHNDIKNMILYFMNPKTANEETYNIK